MKQLFAIFFTGALFASVGFFVGKASTTQTSLSVFATPTPIPTPLARYAIPFLESAQVPAAHLTAGQTLKTTKDFVSSEFIMEFDPTISGETTKKVTGLLNLPVAEGKYPLVVMIRGYVDPSIYTTGVGTKNAGEYFVQNGFITIAPDFLGYAGSDTEAGNIFESRFQTYTTVLTLLESISTPGFETLTNSKWDGKNILIWAHSNGGQIALTTLAITGESYPTVLWAPVSKPFPYNVLYYTDESTDGGKLIRGELSKFENLYNIDDYTFTNFLEQIKAPIEFDQGTSDEAIPFMWTRSISAQLTTLGLEIVYNEYPGADHNLRPKWESAIENNLEFYKNHLK